MKQKIARQQFELMVALSTGKRGTPTGETVMGMLVFKIEEYDVRAELLKEYEVIDDNSDAS